MSLRHSAVASAVAALFGILLLGGTATWATWTDSTESEVTTLTAGSLTAQISQSGPTSVELDETTGGSAPADQALGIYPQQGSEGLIPGVQGQQWEYTLINDASSDVAADAFLRFQVAPQNAAAYEEVREYLQASVNIEGQQPIPVPAESLASAGNNIPMNLGARLEPGEEVHVTLTLYIPLVTEENPNLAVNLNNLRSLNLDIEEVFVMSNTFHLSQAGGPS